VCFQRSGSYITTRTSSGIAPVSRSVSNAATLAHDLASIAGDKPINIGGDAAEHYNNGVIAAITQLSAYGDEGTISDDDAQAYLAAHPYNEAKGLELINTQYWAATFFNEYEAWSNYRRTGYPQLKPVTYPSSQSPGAIPRRMAYSTVDKQINGTNYAAAVAGLDGGDKITSRMWWDVK